MSHIAPWRHFKQAQDGAAAAGGLIYAAAAIYAWRAMPGLQASKLQLMLLVPAGFFAVASAPPLLFAPLRRLLLQYVWASFVAGFGQSAGSFAASVALFAGAAGFIAWRVVADAAASRYPLGVLCGCAAGLGVLLAQAVLTRRLEREPDVRAVIEAG